MDRHSDNYAGQLCTMMQSAIWQAWAPHRPPGDLVSFVDVRRMGDTPKARVDEAERRYAWLKRGHTPGTYSTAWDPEDIEDAATYDDVMDSLAGCNRAWWREAEHDRKEQERARKRLHSRFGPSRRVANDA